MGPTAAGSTDSVRGEIGQLKRLLASDPGNLPLLRRCAELAIELGEYPDALVTASAALELAPGDPMAMFYRASALIGLKHYEQAAECLGLLQSHGVSNPAIAMNSGLCRYLLGDYDAALAQLDPLLGAGHSSPDILRLAVSSRHYLGDVEAAVALADRYPAGVANSGTAGVYALAYLDAGRSEDAGRCARVALGLDPDNVDALIVEGTLKLAQIDTAAAEVSFRRVLERMPNSGRAWIGIGSIALLSQRIEAARDFLQRGVEAMPNHVGSWHMLGWACLVGGDLDAAEQMFRQALALDRNFAETHGAIAAVNALRGRFREARAEIELAERLDRNSLAARFATAVLTAASGDRAVAHSLVRTTIAGLIPRVSTRAGRVLAGAIEVPDPTRH